MGPVPAFAGRDHKRTARTVERSDTCVQRKGFWEVVFEAGIFSEAAVSWVGQPGRGNSSGKGAEGESMWHHGDQRATSCVGEDSKDSRVERAVPGLSVDCCAFRVQTYCAFRV